MSTLRLAGPILVLLGCAWGLSLVAQDASKSKQPDAKQSEAKPAEAGSAQPEEDGAADDATADAIQRTAEAFIKAYNAHDARTLSELFLPEALVYDEDLRSVAGRENIEKRFAAVFEDTPEVKIELSVTTVDRIGKSMAVEIGVAQTTAAPSAIPERSRYVVLHVEREGKWKMALVRDMPDEPTAHEHLLPLAWLVGNWIDESREGKVATSCRWDESRNYLLQDITVHRAGEPTMKITQRIGWDPLTKRIKAWMFDSDGGYGESVWTPTETGWLMKATAVRSDGTTASSTNSIETDGYDAYGWRSVDRVVGNEIDPDIEVRVVRQPPEPEAGQ